MKNKFDSLLSSSVLTALVIMVGLFASVFLVFVKIESLLPKFDWSLRLASVSSCFEIARSEAKDAKTGEMVIKINNDIFELCMKEKGYR